MNEHTVTDGTVNRSRCCRVIEAARLDRERHDDAIG